ncbi:MAG: hypothetical protein KGV43_00910 [Arcobacter sp.]|nr:hypothetical protein [Arcobacter sp.]
MITNIIESNEYKDLITKQIIETIELLLEKNQEFSITANIEPVMFTPDLPASIKKQLPKFTLFILSNYTYSTIEIKDNYLSFEAGFGSENFGSKVEIPIHSIFQIVIDESLLLINSAATVEKFNTNTKEKSMNVFKNNPKNKKFT